MENVYNIGETTAFRSQEVFLKKCSYIGHAMPVWSVEHAIQCLDMIGNSNYSEHCLPFAIRLVEGGELVQIAEDNGEFGCGELLAECLEKLEGYNVLVCVSRKVTDSFVVEMFQNQVLNTVKKAGGSAIDLLHEHLRKKEEAKASQASAPPKLAVRLPPAAAPGNVLTSLPLQQSSRTPRVRAPLAVKTVSVDQSFQFPNLSSPRPQQRSR